MIKRLIKKTPVLASLARGLWSYFWGNAGQSEKPVTTAYWESRYAKGGTSGSGSYGRLAEFKARLLNDFVAAESIHSVIEFGCGDGNQLLLARYPSYIGLDVSRSALSRCLATFLDDSSKSFYLYDSLCFVDNARLFRADLALSLDVLFHLLEDETYDAYMRHLFLASERFVAIYSSNFDAARCTHERRRCFTKWIEINMPGWSLCSFVRNPYPYDARNPDETSHSDFYFFEKGGPESARHASAPVSSHRP